MKTTIENLKAAIENETLPCTRCKGAKVLTYGDNIPARPCFYCDGLGHFSFRAADLPYLIKTSILGRGGKVRKSPPVAFADRNTVEARRRYYLWRLFRFHSGADVTMPMMAEFNAEGDPYTVLLEALAEHTARLITGHGSAGAARWGSLLGTGGPAPAGLPDTAYEGGPVATSGKPIEEAFELGTDEAIRAFRSRLFQ